jgi:hypothetical protein
MKSISTAVCVVTVLAFPALAQDSASTRSDASRVLTLTGEPVGAPLPVDRAEGDFATTLDTAFTYQGRLEESGAPANGRYDIRFTLYDDMGVLVAGPICVDNITVTDGLFTVELDFGPVFNGDERRLEIGVRAGGALGNCDLGVYTTLTPRQAINPTPYAISLRLPFAGSRLLPDGDVFSILNTTTASSSSGVRGIIGTPAIFGFIDSAGVQGDSSQNVGAGVLGISDEYVGVIGYSAGDGGRGVFGRTDGPNAEAVWGWATDANSKALYGWASDPSSWAGYFEGRSYFSGNVGIGISNPTSTLQVNGTTRTNAFQMTTGAAAGRVLTSDASGNAAWQAPAPTSNTALFVSGGGTVPSATTQFLSPVLTVTISSGQKIHVVANRAFGSLSSDGAANLDLYIGYRVAGSGAAPTLLGGGMFDIRVPQNTRMPFGISAVISGLPAGTYEVGMAGDDDGNGNWNWNEWGYVSVVVLN